MISPYCRQIEIGNYPGPTICFSCKTKFEIDDRAKSVFANIASHGFRSKGLFALNAGWFRKPDGDFVSIVGASSTRRHVNKKAETA
jgi:hypothetical protein